jgi:hypothetical protein
MKTKRYCSPNNNGDHISCIPKPILKKIARILNDQSDCSKISLSCKPKKLYERIKEEVLKISDCNKEPCWLKIKEFKNNLPKEDYIELKKSFRPEKPKSWKDNPNQWLTTENINHVMEQYQEAHPTFKYYGALPIDFNKKDIHGECKVSDLCQVNISDLLDQKKETIGMVFNIDPSTKGGQHWFTMFIDLVGNNLKKPFIYYYDSVKGDIQDEIFSLIKNIQSQYKEIFPKKELGFTFNDIQHQYGDSECGVYCIHFLSEMLQGKSFTDYINLSLSDEEMEKFRDVFFI